VAMVHPLTGAVYERDEDGLVRVTESDGRVGWFTPQGDHVRGEVRSADPHIIDWVGGRQPKTMSGRLRHSPRSAPS
jgi:hypothetical protein